MAIAIGTSTGEDDVVSAINTTPLVDVMLVLLIIFLITIPVVTHTVPVELPKQTAQPRQTKPENINIAVTRGGETYWNEVRVANDDELLTKLKAVAVGDPQPEVQIRGDAESAYEPVGRVFLACQRAGIAHVGFVTEPPPRG